MRILIALFLVCLVAGCANYKSRKDVAVDEGDFNSIAKVGLKKIDPEDTITTVVIPPGLDPRVRAAFKRFKTVISPAQIPQSQNYKLPDGYFALKTFLIADGEAIMDD